MVQNIKSEAVKSRRTNNLIYIFRNYDYLG